MYNQEIFPYMLLIVDYRFLLYPISSLFQGKELASGDLSYGAACSSNDLTGYSERFVQWVSHGNMLFP